jgi:endonuclease III
VTSASFQIGNRGGPGRPRRDVAVPTANEVCKLARSFSQEALETLVKMMRNAKLPGAVRIKAAEAVLNRGIGLPAVAVDVTVQRLVAKKLVELNVDELRAIETRLAEQAIDVTPVAEATLPIIHGPPPKIYDDKDED